MFVIDPLRQTNPTSNFCAKLYAFLCWWKGRITRRRTAEQSWGKKEMREEQGKGWLGWLGSTAKVFLIFKFLNLACLMAPWNMCPAFWRASFLLFLYTLCFFLAATSPLLLYLFLLLGFCFYCSRFCFSCSAFGFTAACVGKGYGKASQAEWNKARLW